MPVERKQCTAGSCTCKAQGLPCTDACTCSSCDNKLTPVEEAMEIEYLSDSDSEEEYSEEDEIVEDQ